MNESNPFDVTQDQQGIPIPKEHGPPAQSPQRIGRYRIEKLLGMGGFGLVYLAHDEQLNRPVAVEVPHARLISKPGDAEAYLAEARTVANLDHPGIVPVHDVGSTEDYPCYVVSKYIQGTALATKLGQQRLKYREVAELVANVADALHYAHKQGLVHRDVKPGNILIGDDGKAYVVDFGLALREENIGKKPNYAGTPAYMSPEQARGEGHRVDGRSDIFSLGVVLYEMLAGRLPFWGDTKAELLEQITGYEARPLRQYDENLPKELERICHKAMAKRASERYSSAHDMAENLRLFLQEQTVIQSGTLPGGVTSVASELQRMTEEQRARIARFTAEVESIRQRLVTSEQELPARQADWERQLREQPAAVPASLSEGLVAHFPLDETEGQETANAVPGRPGGVYAGPDQAEWIPGMMGHAVRLNGNGGHFDCGQVIALERTDSFSYGCWFWTPIKKTNSTILAKMSFGGGVQGIDIATEKDGTKRPRKQ